MTKFHVEHRQPEWAIIPDYALFNPVLSDAGLRFYALCVYALDRGENPLDYVSENDITIIGAELVKANLAKWDENGTDLIFTSPLSNKRQPEPVPAPITKYKVKGQLYLVQSPTGAYKIGRTKNIEDRLKTFGVMLPFEIELLHIIECVDYISAERKMHDHFADQRINGEWFALSPKDIEWIKSIKTDNQL